MADFTIHIGGNSTPLFAHGLAEGEARLTRADQKQRAARDITRSVTGMVGVGTHLIKEKQDKDELEAARAEGPQAVRSVLERRAQGGDEGALGLLEHQLKEEKAVADVMDRFADNIRAVKTQEIAQQNADTLAKSREATVAVQQQNAATSAANAESAKTSREAATSAMQDREKRASIESQARVENMQARTMDLAAKKEASRAQMRMIDDAYRAAGKPIDLPGRLAQGYATLGQQPPEWLAKRLPGVEADPTKSGSSAMERSLSKVPDADLFALANEKQQAKDGTGNMVDTGRPTQRGVDASAEIMRRAEAAAMQGDVRHLRELASLAALPGGPSDAAEASIRLALVSVLKPRIDSLMPQLEQAPDEATWLATLSKAGLTPDDIDAYDALKQAQESP